MKKIVTLLLISFSVQCQIRDQWADPVDYLRDLQVELTKEWPKNRIINLVFHGHSVPAGYFKTPIVNTLEAYPLQVLKQLKTHYPFAVINVINTSVGGENSKSGAGRFETEVLTHRPDVVCIDYALNDQALGLGEAQKAWKFMIEKATEKKIKVILLTPSPDQRVDVADEESTLEKHRKQIIELATGAMVGLVDSYALFKKKQQKGEKISDYMSQVNHPNAKGHELIANEIMRYFK
ncbi:SGNH/GDSL hydrolase family protein [Runella slithyformis]|uniref:Lipase n=1 Tax=Runella slithyformis (strain ATCC 29530 / DSM 19594 / LMG 11500 / NCIMB 11436 / LSU 4) TaxID=761193 RepID=A0A7U4E8L8_RUNSL|nr:SGNH/GDSL hydrolase family protein [Runella slithyformis]AEI51836.1 putative lipase [Runella slithyformis DSM 19594]